MVMPINLRDCVGLDSETCLIRPGLPAPPVVCTAFAELGKDPVLYNTQRQWRPLLELFDSDRLIVLHNGAYDLSCYMDWGPPELRRLIFDAYDADRVLDSMLAQRMVEIETGDVRGKLGLGAVAARYGLDVPKDIVDEDGREVRTGYGRFLNRPLSDYPQVYKDYALNDPYMTLKVFERILSRGLVKRADLAKMGRIHLGLKLTSNFGLRTEPDRVEALEVQARETMARLQDVMLEHKFMRRERNKPAPVRTMANIKLAAARAYGLANLLDEKGSNYRGHDREDLIAKGVLTDGGAMSTSRDVLEQSGDPLLERLGEYGEWSAVLNKDLKIFRAGTILPFHTYFGFAATTRTTSSGPNIQNFRKKKGIRECIRSAYGALVASDYSGLENGTLAQVIVWTLGRHDMANKISAGWDYHCDFGSHIIGGIPYEDMVARYKAGDDEADRCRGAAKPFNFGLPGGLWKPTTVQSYARLSYGVDLPTDRCRELRDLWYATQHEQVAYLKTYVPTLKSGALYAVPIPSTGITRRGATYPAAANTGFQGLGAQVAGYGLYLVARAQMLGEMPGKLCAFIHDENITDCAVEDVDQVKHCQERLMLQAAETLMPDVKMAVETTAMTHWSKKAKALYGPDGRLLVAQS